MIGNVKRFGIWKIDSYMILIFNKFSLYFFFLFLMQHSTRIKIFIVMVILNVLNAWYYTCFGPVIPYYAAATGLDQTHYSYLFFIKTVATIAGGYLTKSLLKTISTQKLTLALLTIAVISLCASTWSLSTVNLGITLFIATGATVGSALIGYNITIKVFLDDQPQYWVQILELFFVIGALGGQFIVSLFEINSFLMLGLSFIIPIIGIIIWPLPDLYDVLTEYGEEGLKLSFRSKALVCIVFFCFATAEMGIASWMPTYSIKAGISDIKGSSLFSLLFWGPNCLVRLLWIYMPTSIEKKLGIALNLVLVAAITALFLQLSGQLQMLCYFAPISIGIFISGVYGFCLSWVVNNGFAFCPEDNAYFLLAYIIGEGLLIMPMGYTMGLFGFKSMIYEVCFFSFVTVVVFILAVNSMEGDKSDYQMLPSEKKEQIAA